MCVRVLSVVVSVTLASLVCPQVYGDGPACANAAGHTVRYGIHETPADPNSPMAFLVTLSLTARAGDCAKTGWSIDEIELRQVAANGGSDWVWTERNPHVSTEDGLWWVSHADVASPQSAEFVLPPHLVGAAVATDPNDPSLDYDFEGVTYTPPAAPELPPYPVTAATTFVFQVEGEPDPTETGESGPTEIDPPAPN